MGWFKKLIKGLRLQISKTGVGVGWSSGKLYDPYYQTRTTPNEDFNKAKENETKEILDKISNKEDKDEDT